ncbi:MAG: PH domain-containing protein [Rhizobiales bacterium]|nr:PH domain-containing protein [Hyphomicrobiales bacterium]
MAQIDAEDEIVVPRAEAHAHWSIFLPAIIVAFLYALIWGFLKITGFGDGALGRLIFLVLVIAPPLLIAQAFLRYYSIGIALTQKHVLLARGWPRTVGRQIALRDIVVVEVNSGILGRWMGAGGIHLLLRNGQRLGISDLADPENIADLIRQNIPSLGQNGS